MLVMGKDHKNYYEAYNDASDLNGDGQIDVGYKPDEIDYYGYFNSNVCYQWSGSNTRFEPRTYTANKKCSGSWSGDFLNYVTTGRFDAMRKVLYGGWRQTDSSNDTVLQGAYFPQDGHSWGKEYDSLERDGYDISEYTPLNIPTAGQYHLFAVTTLADNSAPLLRVLQNSRFRVWNWVSIEGPVADNTCFDASNNHHACVQGSANAWEVIPAASFSGLELTIWKRGAGSGSPGNLSEMNTLFTNHAVATNRCGTGPVTQINKPQDGNPFAGNNGCGNDNFLTRIQGNIHIPQSGTYKFAVDGDDAVDLFIDGDHVVGWYGGHSSNRSDASLDSHSASKYLTAGTHSILFRHQEATGGESWGLFHARNYAASKRDDYQIRVQVCPAAEALREDNCRAYGSGGSVVYKPTGILHDFGEAAAGEKPRMYFGLLTGSQFNNLRGGVLRRNLQNFSSEINPNTGQFKTDVRGIAHTLNSLRMIGGGYGSKTRTRDQSGNWQWSNGTGNCPAFGDRDLNNGECRMWGNPIGEMMLEALSYFAGGSATANFIGGGASQGVNEENTLGLRVESWRDPYKPASEGGAGFLSCSKPVMTVISDINPSYDSGVPGNPWGGSDFTLPSTLSGFSLETEGAKIWNNEFGSGSRSVYIGQSGTATSDGAPTLKSASSFGTIRGLSPEEPTKQGSYSAAAVASYGWTKNGRINELSDEKVRTYAVAVASPLPRIEFPVNGQMVTLVPFAKTSSGTFGGGARKPTNTIVDFYVEEFVNLPGQDVDNDINGGRPYAVFRINYEDVEQGNDHDMDAIVRYEIKATADGNVEVNLRSEYAAGSANQVMGYVISGTTKDGVYLEVRDTDSNSGLPYALHTPPGHDPGDCAGSTSAECTLLPHSASRTFEPGGTGTVTNLRDPLWYAAKYGGFNDGDGSGTPNLRAEWDEDNDGNPDNYFLVTNALSLKEALERAFTKIISDSQPSGGVAASGARVSAGFLAYVPWFTPTDWSGDLRAHKLNPATNQLMAMTWSAHTRLAEVSDAGVATQGSTGRNMYYIDPAASAGNRQKAFTLTGLGGEAGAASKLAVPPTEVEDLVSYLRGDHRLEMRNGGVLRDRGSRLGDIATQPAVLDKASFGYLNLPVAQGGGYGAGGYAKFVESKDSRTPVVFAAANDGFLHAFNASDDPVNGGKEIFAVAPSNVLGRLQQLASPAYTHRYFVNGDPVVGDAYIGGSWKTVLLGTTGAGGRSVFALDVTDPATDGAKVLWEFSHPDLGLTIGRPKIALLPNGQWAAVFGNGYNSDNNKAFLFVVNLQTGDLIARVATNDEGDSDVPNGLATPAIIDLEGDGRTDVVYAGDYYGNLWKFDFGDSSGSLSTDTLKLFTATDSGSPAKRQSITGGITAAHHPVRGQLVFFGTGSYFLEGDNAAPTSADQVQSLYGIWDDDVNVDRSQLVKQDLSMRDDGLRETTQHVVDWSSKRGWFVDLKAGNDVTGERFFADPTVVLGRVLFNTYITEGDECEPGGLTWQNMFSITSGAGGYSAGGVSSQQAPPGSGPPVGAPTVTTRRTGGDEGEDCDPDDPDCVSTNPGSDEDGNPLDLGVASPRGCIVSVDLLTASGMSPLLRLACGRQSWRQMH